MQENFELIHWNEAGAILNEVKDESIRRVIDRATTIARHQFYAKKPEDRGSHFDLGFFVEVMLELLRDKTVVQKELNGERPGAWFEEGDN